MEPLNLLHLPDNLLEEIIGRLSFDEIATLRIVCPRFNEVGKRLLNCGFRAVERFHAKCLKEVKSQLPRRESERRDHPLSHHCNILSGIETRLSLLNMTFLKYIDAKLCCFIPGKIIDEVYRVLTFVQETKNEFLREDLSTDVLNNLLKDLRANIILKELRDISSMAMEHFEEKILPELRTSIVSSLATTSSSSSPPHFSLSLPSFVSLSPVQGISHGKLSRETVDKQLTSLHVANKHNKNSLNFLKKQISSLQSKCNEASRKVSEQEQVILEVNRVINEHTSKLSDQENKLTKTNQKILELNKKLFENEQKMSSLFDLLNRRGLLHEETSSSKSRVSGLRDTDDASSTSTNGESAQQAAAYFLSASVPPVMPMPLPASHQPYENSPQPATSNLSPLAPTVGKGRRCKVLAGPSKHAQSSDGTLEDAPGGESRSTGTSGSSSSNTRMTRKRTTFQKAQNSKVKRHRC